VQDFSDVYPIWVTPRCHDTTGPCLFASWYYGLKCILSKSDKGMHKKRKKILGIEIPYLVCLLRVELCHVAGSLGDPVDGIDATHSSQSSGSPSLLFCRTSWVDVVDVWVRPPLVVNGMAHGSGGEEVKEPSPPRNILNGRFSFTSMV
jgi:hypothetical protein